MAYQHWVPFNWRKRRVHLRVCAWLIYCSPVEHQLGELVIKVEGDVFFTDLPLSAGTCWIRVVAEFPNCIYEDWRRVEKRRVYVDPRAPKPPPPQKPGVRPVTPGGKGVVVNGSNEVGHIPHRIQLIEAPAGEPMSGKIVSQHRVQPGDAEDARGPQTTLFSVPGSTVPGAAQDHLWATRRWFLRTVADGGGESATITEVEVPVLPRPGHVGQILAEIDADAATVTNFPAPGPDDPFELLAPGGITLMRYPDIADGPGWAAKNWGWFGAPGILATQVPSTFVQKATIESIELDLGSDVTFGLDLFDQQHRVDSEGAWATWDWKHMSMVRREPVAFYRDDTYDQHARELGPRYAAVRTRRDHRPTDPIRESCWFVCVGDAPGGGVWEAYVPGAQYRGRYLKVRLVMEEETGYHQLATGTVRVVILWEKQHEHGLVNIPAGTPAPGVPVTLPVNPVTGGPLFPNTLSVVTSAYNQFAPVHVYPAGFAAGLGLFTLYAIDPATGMPPAFPVTAAWHAMGH